jgi:hypothetical protein
MNNSNWVPYKIPPCPEPEDKIYALSIKDGATPDKNPSQFLEWKEILPRGEDKGDLLYWDPAEGEGGEWVILPPPSGTDTKVLASNGGVPYWLGTEECD